MVNEHGLGLREVLVALWHIQTIEPGVLRAESFCCALCLLVVEEENVGGDAGIGREDAAWQTEWLASLASTMAMGVARL